MSCYLLDANVLIALLWPAHESHDGVQRWFARNARHGWATCPFTQAAFVRIVSNPAFSCDAVAPWEAVEILHKNLNHLTHRFWNAGLGFFEAVEPFRQSLVGHRQVTDAYLLGLAIHQEGTLATLDRSISALLPDKSPEQHRIEVIGV